MKPLVTERLILRKWQDGDRALFHEINSDDRVMEFFPMRRNRAESDAVMDLLCERIDRHGFGFTAIELKRTGECIGFCGLSRIESLPTISDGSVEIGWRLATRFWGEGFASESARAWLNHGFETLGLDEIFSFAVHDNHRSTAVMRRIGMRRDESLDFDHPRVPESHPHMRRHVVYRMTAAEHAG